MFNQSRVRGNGNFGSIKSVKTSDAKRIMEKRERMDERRMDEVNEVKSDVQLNKYETQN